LALANDNFLLAARSQPVDRIPVWFMRQAGRSLPGYRKLREKYGVLELTRTPELAAQVSLEPVERLGVDAAILFADIMLLPIAMGIEVQIVDSVGPVLDAPLDSPADLKRLQPFTPDRVEYLQQTIKLLRPALPVPLIGFSAAPFTLASYLIEGRPTRTWAKTKRFMFEQPEAWDRLMTILSNAVIAYLEAQVAAGVQAVQLFDSWVGCLAPQAYRDYVWPHVKHIFKALESQKVPRIHFGTDTAGLLADFAGVDAEVIGLDHRVELSAARRLIPRQALQGNLDPIVLLSDQAVVQAQAAQLLDALPSHTGYIFNLGHGVNPDTDDVKLKALVEYVHAQPVRR
jgi:uroporphyrinogen decarboxylase